MYMTYYRHCKCLLSLWLWAMACAWGVQAADRPKYAPHGMVLGDTLPAVVKAADGRVTVDSSVYRRGYLPQLGLQYAGALGLVSVSAGWLLARQHLMAELYLGYLPPSAEMQVPLTPSFKLKYAPFGRGFVGRQWYAALYTGMMVNYTFGDNYFVRTSVVQYPKHYYSVPTAFRAGFFVGAELRPSAWSAWAASHMPFVRAVYLECYTLDLYLASAVRNREYFKPWDIVKLAIGMRFDPFWKRRGG